MHTNEFLNNLLSIIAGFITSVSVYLLKIDWVVFYTTSMKIGEAFIIGIVGGAGGLLGKKIIYKLFNKDKKPNK